jgi:hypothetical protein
MKKSAGMLSDDRDIERTKRASARNPGKNNFGFGGKLTFNLALPSGMFLAWSPASWRDARR